MIFIMVRRNTEKKDNNCEDRWITLSRENPNQLRATLWIEILRTEILD